MASSSSSLSSSKYPFPSTFSVANFVSIKLCKSNYPLWKTQMDCVIVSQDLVGFIDGSISKPVPSILTNQNYLLWRRTDHLLKGWILGSLSEEVLVSVIHLETSRDVWADLEEKLSPPAASSHEENKWLQASSEDGLKFLSTLLLLLSCKISLIFLERVTGKRSHQRIEESPPFIN
ncbi:hypothetical protein LguiB_016490 [Lonicera macranthoides]